MQKMEIKVFKTQTEDLHTGFKSTKIQHKYKYVVLIRLSELLQLYKSKTKNKSNSSAGLNVLIEKKFVFMLTIHENSDNEQKKFFKHLQSEHSPG